MLADGHDQDAMRCSMYSFAWSMHTVASMSYPPEQSVTVQCMHDTDAPKSSTHRENSVAVGPDAEVDENAAGSASFGQNATVEVEPDSSVALG